MTKCPLTRGVHLWEVSVKRRFDCILSFAVNHPCGSVWTLHRWNVRVGFKRLQTSFEWPEMARIEIDYTLKILG